MQKNYTLSRRALLNKNQLACIFR